MYWYDFVPIMAGIVISPLAGTISYLLSLVYSITGVFYLLYNFVPVIAEVGQPGVHFYVSLGHSILVNPAAIYISVIHQPGDPATVFFFAIH